MCNWYLYTLKMKLLNMRKNLNAINNIQASSAHYKNIKF